MLDALQIGFRSGAAMEYEDAGVEFIDSIGRYQLRTPHGDVERWRYGTIEFAHASAREAVDGSAWEGNTWAIIDAESGDVVEEFDPSTPTEMAS